VRERKEILKRLKLIQPREEPDFFEILAVHLFVFVWGNSLIP
jgi:hypothetical protein